MTNQGSQTGTVESILSKRVTELELTVRAHNCLMNGNIIYVGDLIRKTPRELLRISNMGKKSLTVIEEELERYGLRLGMEDRDIVDDKHGSRADDLENFIRVMWLLGYGGIGSVSELIRKTGDELLVMPEMSPADLSIVRDGLEKWGLRLGMHHPNPPVLEVCCEGANTVKEELLYVVNRLLSGAHQNRARCFIRYRGIDGGEALTLQEIADQAIEYGFNKPVSRERIRQVIDQAEERLHHRSKNARFVKWESTIQEVEGRGSGDNPIWTIRHFVSLFGYGSAPNPVRIFDQLKTMSDILGTDFPFKSVATEDDEIIVRLRDTDTPKALHALEKLNSNMYHNLEESLKRIDCNETSLKRIIEVHPRWEFLDDAYQYFWRKPKFPLQNYRITGNVILTCLCKIFSVAEEAKTLDIARSIPRHKLVHRDIPTVILEGIAKQSGLFEVGGGIIVKKAKCEWMTLSQRDLALLRVCVEHGQVVSSSVIYSFLARYGLTKQSATIAVVYSPFMIHIRSGVGSKEGIYKFILRPEHINLGSLERRINDEDG